MKLGDSSIMPISDKISGENIHAKKRKSVMLIKSIPNG
jgi:hypothetical protein